MEQLDFRGKPRSRYQTFNDEPSRTVQSDAKRADIKHILGKYQQLGLVQELNRAEAQFADLTEFTDYADLMRNVRTAEAEFMKLPSKARKVFNHDVAAFLDAAHDPEKRDLLVEAGLLEAEPVVVKEPAPLDPPPAE